MQPWRDPQHENAAQPTDDPQPPGGVFGGAAARGRGRGRHFGPQPPPPPHRGPGMRASPARGAGAAAEPFWRPGRAPPSPPLRPGPTPLPPPPAANWHGRGTGRGRGRGVSPPGRWGETTDSMGPQRFAATAPLHISLEEPYASNREVQTFLTLSAVRYSVACS